ncbi:hypothetical protein, partial [Morganella sp. HMSC11D09]|uniref:hypothetical protein n=1 Tax=Morganella sp. HMSC11D09 TaxID=1581087 RepID=UPI001AEFE9A5
LVSIGDWWQITAHALATWPQIYNRPRIHQSQYLLDARLSGLSVLRLSSLSTVKESDNMNIPQSK